jgi:hypothetical protein
MGLEGFLFAFASTVQMTMTVIVSGMFLIAGWSVALSKRAHGESLTIFRDSRPLILALVVNLTGLVFLVFRSNFSDPQRHLRLQDLTILAVVIASTVLIAKSARTFRRSSGNGARILSIGSNLILVFSILGLIAILAGVPGAIETWR